MTDRLREEEVIIQAVLTFLSQGSLCREYLEKQGAVVRFQLVETQHFPSVVPVG